MSLLCWLLGGHRWVPVRRYTDDPMDLAPRYATLCQRCWKHK